MAKLTEYESLKRKFGLKQGKIQKLEKKVNTLYVWSTEEMSPEQRQMLLLKASDIRSDLVELRRELDRIHYAMYHRNYYA